MSGSHFMRMRERALPFLCTFSLAWTDWSNKSLAHAVAVVLNIVNIKGCALVLLALWYLDPCLKPVIILFLLPFLFHFTFNSKSKNPVKQNQGHGVDKTTRRGLLQTQLLLLIYRRFLETTTAKTTDRPFLHTLCQ